VPRNEIEAAYFTLLRAREELAELRRYDEYLQAEAQRLRRSTSEGAALADQVPRRHLRAVRHTDQPLKDAVDRRLEVIAGERTRLPDRIQAAEAFVTACEEEHAQLKGGG
jgi:hypothetical protein